MVIEGGRGNFKAFRTFRTCPDQPTEIGLGKIAERELVADTDSLVPPFNLGREALFKGVAEGRCKTAAHFKIVPRSAKADS